MSLHRAWWGVAASILLVWWSAFDHPLYPSDEGRYATVAATMAESGDWVVPVLGGTPHLTKPPLAYWLEGAAIAAFGRTEMAVRLPSTLAAGVVLVAIFVVLRNARGATAATCAALLYGILPMAVMVARLGATDGLLTCFWTLALLAGYRVLSGAARSPLECLALWVALGLAALTKGPVALGPLAILVAWRMLAGDNRSLLMLRPWWGVLIAILPIACWSIAVILRDSSMVSALLGTWWEQSVGRATGSLGKREPWWFYAPIFLVAFFPASAMLTLPWLNVPARDAWRTVRSGSLEALLVLAVALPLVGFSLAAGKLPQYLAPIGPPLAMLVGTMVARRWLGGDAGAAGPWSRAPDVRWTVLACCAVAAVALPSAAWALARELDLTPTLLASSFLLALPTLGVAWLAYRWRTPSARRTAFGVAWLGFAGAWIVAFHAENALLERESPRLLADAIARAVGDDTPIFAIGHNDATRTFYRRGPVSELGGNPPPWTVDEAIMASRGAVFSIEEWEELVRERPTIVQLVEPLEEVPGFFRRRYVVARVTWRPLPAKPG